MMSLCTVCGNFGALVFLSSELRETHGFSFWDSLIVASAIVSHCDLLASEDMQDGREVGGTLIKNIFLG
jgi:predicted nucleic acid-binding protein